MKIEKAAEAPQTEKQEWAVLLHVLINNNNQLGIKKPDQMPMKEAIQALRILADGLEQSIGGETDGKNN